MESVAYRQGGPLYVILFGRELNRLTEEQVLNDWQTKLYLIVQYLVHSPPVARKITGMLLESESDALLQAMVRNHYRFLNPAMDISTTELQAIEASINQFNELLDAARNELLREANAGELNLESYVVRGPNGSASLRRNFYNSGIRVGPLTRRVPNRNRANSTRNNGVSNRVNSNRNNGVSNRANSNRNNGISNRANSNRNNGVSNRANSNRNNGAFLNNSDVVAVPSSTDIVPIIGPNIEVPNNSNAASNKQKAYNNLLKNIKTMPTEGGKAILEAAAEKYKQLVELGKELYGVTDSKVIEHMLFYIDIRAAIMRLNRLPPDEIIALYKEVVAAAKSAQPINDKVYVSALNLYGGFLSVIPAHRLEGFKQYKQAYNHAKEYLPQDDDVRISVAVNYVNAFADLVQKQSPATSPDAFIFKQADEALTEVIKSLPEDYKYMADLLARHAMLKLRRMETAAAIILGDKAIAKFKSLPQNSMVLDKITKLESFIKNAKKARKNLSNKIGPK